jgi:hypothetical protein
MIQASTANDNVSIKRGSEMPMVTLRMITWSQDHHMLQRSISGDHIVLCRSRSPALFFFVVASVFKLGLASRSSRDTPRYWLLEETDWMVALGMGKN